eukprot:219453-Hanusia_phi.AAC.2
MPPRPPVPARSTAGGQLGARSSAGHLALEAPHKGLARPAAGSEHRSQRLNGVGRVDGEVVEEDQAPAASRREHQRLRGRPGDAVDREDGGLEDEERRCLQGGPGEVNADDAVSSSGSEEVGAERRGSDGGHWPHVRMEGVADGVLHARHLNLGGGVGVAESVCCRASLRLEHVVDLGVVEEAAEDPPGLSPEQEPSRRLSPHAREPPRPHSLRPDAVRSRREAHQRPQLDVFSVPQPPQHQLPLKRARQQVEVAR